MWWQEEPEIPKNVQLSKYFWTMGGIYKKQILCVVWYLNSSLTL